MNTCLQDAPLDLRLSDREVLERVSKTLRGIAVTVEHIDMPKDLKDSMLASVADIEGVFCKNRLKP